jgi:hypothetical protein
VSGSEDDVSEYGAEQLTAGFRSMSMLAGLVQRGGRPAPVTPTIPLRTGEKQYGWFPVAVAGAGRRVAVITNQRLILDPSLEYGLRTIARVRPEPDEWTITLEVRGRDEPVVVSGPWVPWLGVVICAELYGTAWPPGHRLPGVVPAPRRNRLTTGACTGR